MARDFLRDTSGILRAPALGSGRVGLRGAQRPGSRQQRAPSRAQAAHAGSAFVARRGGCICREARRARSADTGESVPCLSARRLRQSGQSLERLAAKSPGKVVLIHGDTHLYREDEPLPGLRRIEVWGSPIVSWIQASASPGSTPHRRRALRLRGEPARRSARAAESGGRAGRRAVEGVAGVFGERVSGIHATHSRSTLFRLRDRRIPMRAMTTKLTNQSGSTADSLTHAVAASYSLLLRGPP